LLLEADMRTPAPGRSVQIYSHRPGRMELPRYLRTERTGSDGTVGVDLAAGSYIVCAPGATPGSPAPRSARATVGTGPVLVHLVEAPPSARQRFDVRAGFDPRPGIAPKLVLRRVDDGSGARFEQPGVLLPGSNAFDLDLPAGRYTVEVLPLGELLVDRAARELSVGPERAAFAVEVRGNPGRIDVTLAGLSAEQLPARVYPQPVEGLASDAPESTWWGPYKWHRVDLQVPTLDGPRRVLVFGADGTFRSRAPVDLSGDAARVELEPALRVVVDWFGWDPRRDADAVVFAVGEAEAARTLRPRFGAGHPELERPALGGELVVPRTGSLRLECRRADGSLAWEWSAEVAADPVRVRIGSP
jgi:hypothetical protein